MRRLVAIGVLLAACKGRDEAKGGAAHYVASPGPSKYDGKANLPAAQPAAGDAALALDEGKLGAKEQERDQAVDHAKTAGVVASFHSAAGQKAPANVKTPASGPESAPRAWFPETFLFEPLIVTADDGTATVPVKVPDRLTTWRVLALAHSRSGAQGGAVTSFVGTLPTYVDLVVPPFLVVGDEIRLPIQLVNTTATPVTETLSLAAAGATLTAKGGRTTIPAQGSLVEYATLRATAAGTIAVEARLGATDAVRRTIDVIPSGRPVTVTKGGTLAQPRTLTLDGPVGADPGTDRARLQVFPGALALLRSEFEMVMKQMGTTSIATITKSYLAPTTG